MSKYKAFVVEEIETNIYKRSIQEKEIKPLNNNFVLIEVHYSSLNYKDALSAKGHKGITRNYPHTPGIDASGIIADSKSNNFKIGDKVLVTGYDLGMNTDGGFAEYISVPDEWVVPLPKNLSLKEAMILGTAGFTAGLCINQFYKHDIRPEMGKILVTGSTGGVGCLSLAILSKLGYNVVASSGKYDQNNFLHNLGAKEIISREDVRNDSPKPLLQKKWIAAIDNIGGTTLSTIIKSLEHHGIVCLVGLVESDMLITTVYPFILRGVKLIGIDSAEQKMDLRKKIWYELSTFWKPENLNNIYREISLYELDLEINKILLGGQVGRILINLKKYHS